MKAYSSENVYDAAIRRMIPPYAEGHRIIVAYSSGKDSTCTLEIAIEAARATGRLPVEVWMLDIEIMYPGTFEYAERVANRPEVKMHWIISDEAELNIFNRKEPFYWAFDKQVKPEDWMRPPPPWAIWTDEKDLYEIVNPKSFPPPEGKNLYVAMGVRASESRRRNMIIHQSGGATSGMAKIHGSTTDHTGEVHIRPIYDWTTKDVWLAIKEKQWDYNDAYNVMTRFGIKREAQRIAPVAMTTGGAMLLKVASRAWPEWFDRLSHRLPGVKLAALYGKQAITPVRRPDETWKQAYQRLNIDDAPKWLAERAEKYRAVKVAQHSKHATDDIMEIAACPTCVGLSWQKMTHDMYLGDPMLLSVNCPEIGYLQPETIRPGAGYIGNKMKF